MVAYSQNKIVNIDTMFFNIDINKKIILINKDIGELNSSYTESPNSISSADITYTLITPVIKFETGTTYKVTVTIQYLPRSTGVLLNISF
jgi:hypothetical protein